MLDGACIFKVVTPACTLVSGHALTMRPYSRPDILTNPVQRYEDNLYLPNFFTEYLVCIHDLTSFAFLLRQSHLAI